MWSFVHCSFNKNLCRCYNGWWTKISPKKYNPFGNTFCFLSSKPYQPSKEIIRNNERLNDKKLLLLCNCAHSITIIKMHLEQYFIYKNLSFFESMAKVVPRWLIAPRSFISNQKRYWRRKLSVHFHCFRNIKKYVRQKPSCIQSRMMDICVENPSNDRISAK